MKYRPDIGRIKRDILGYGAAVLLAFFVMGLLEYFFHSVCAFQILFGIPCPACGMTRAFFLFLKGDIFEALRMHPLFPVIGFFFLFVIYSRYFKKYSGKSVTICAIIILAMGLFLYTYRMCHDFPIREPMIYKADNLLIKVLFHQLGS